MHYRYIRFVGLTLSALLAACSGNASTPVPSATATPQAAQLLGSSGSAGLPSNFVFSQYKDVGTYTNWNHNDILSSAVTGTYQVLATAMPVASGNNTITLAFATGTCGTSSETWAGIPPSNIVNDNIQQQFATYGIKYVVGTGGSAGTFYCPTPDAFLNFIQTYYSPNMVGVDFDIERGQSQAVVDSFINDVIAAESQYPQLRFSFTIATTAPVLFATASLGSEGQLVVQEIKRLRLTRYNNYTINLMVMDYGTPPTLGLCFMLNGVCNMGLSAIQAAQDFERLYGAANGIPYANLELTPMIGMNDVTDETFTVHDADTLAAFAKQYGIAGIHFWSFDRDTDCTLKYVSGICNSTGGAGALGYTKRFLTDLSL